MKSVDNTRCESAGLDYNDFMHNWSCDIEKLRDHSKKGAALFELEQKVNYGLARSRISKKQLLRYWKELQLDPDRRRFLSFLLWNRKS